MFLWKEGWTMTIQTAFRNGWKAYTAKFGGSMRFLAIELCITLASLTPALFLWNEKLRWGALLAIPFFALLVFPARMNAARTMRDALNGGDLCSLQLVDTENYGRDLVNGILRMVLIMIWSLPLFAAAILTKHYVSGETDVFTLLGWVTQFGGGGRDGLVNGVIYLALIALATVLLVLVGCGFHSADRHCYIREKRDLIRGHRGKNFLCWLLAALVTFLPLIIALVINILRYAPVLADLNGLINSFIKGKAELPSTKLTLMLLAIGGVLCLPLQPLRSLITAAFVDGLEKA